LLLNPAGDNLFVAEFEKKADLDRVRNGPPWVVGTRAVLLEDFNVDLKPRDMIFDRLRLWVRILNLPFGYMQKKWGTVIASPIGIAGSVPVVDCDNTGRCWGSYMRVRVEVDVDKPLRRGVTVFSQRRNATDWFNLQYEDLPHYCFSCGILGHSSTDCKNPGEKDDEGKLPYSSDKLVAPDERTKKTQGARSSSGSVSAGQGRYSSHAANKKPGQSSNTGAAQKSKDKQGAPNEVSSPLKKKPSRTPAGSAKARKGHGKEKASGQEEGEKLAGRKRKQEYRVKVAPLLIKPVPAEQLALVVHQNQPAEVVSASEDASYDSNKKSKMGVQSGSADQAGAAEQPCHTQ
jgi:hypothetical protein